jgi:hypothetical protein
MNTEREMLDSVARLEAAEEAGTAPAPVTYHWWPRMKALIGLALVMVLLLAHEGSALRTYEGLNEQNERVRWICVYSAQNAWLGGFDQGFGCPPFCG